MHKETALTVLAQLLLDLVLVRASNDAHLDKLHM